MRTKAAVALPQHLRVHGRVVHFRIKSVAGVMAQRRNVIHEKYTGCGSSSRRFVQKKIAKKRLNRINVFLWAVQHSSVSLFFCIIFFFHPCFAFLLHFGSNTKLTYFLKPDLLGPGYTFWQAQPFLHAVVKKGTKP